MINDRFWVIPQSPLDKLVSNIYTFPRRTKSPMRQHYNYLDLPVQDIKYQKPGHMARGTGHFFELPREIRDLVYHNIWLGLPDLVVPYLGRKSLIRYGATNEACAKAPYEPWSRMEKLPPWLFLSKKFHEECIALLMEQVEWVWLPRGGFSHNAGSSALFGPASAQIVTLKLSLYHDGKISNARNYTEATNIRDNEMSHSRIAEAMSASGKPRTLHLWIDLYHEESTLYNENLGYYVDLGDLGSLGEFKYANVETLVIYAWDDSATSLVLRPDRRETMKKAITGIGNEIFAWPQFKLQGQKQWTEDYESHTVLYHWCRLGLGSLSDIKPHSKFQPKLFHTSEGSSLGKPKSYQVIAPL